MGHEEHVVIAFLVEHGGYAVAVRRHGSLHEIAEHQGRERIERGCHAVIGMDAGAVIMVESH